MNREQQKQVRQIAEAWVGFPEDGIAHEPADAQDPRGYLVRRYGIRDPHVQDAWLTKGKEPEDIENQFPRDKIITGEYKKRIAHTTIALGNMYRAAQFDQFEDSIDYLARPEDGFLACLRDLVIFIENPGGIYGNLQNIHKALEDFHSRLREREPNVVHKMDFRGEYVQFELARWRNATTAARDRFRAIDFGLDARDPDALAQAEVRILDALYFLLNDLTDELDRIAGAAYPNSFGSPGGPLSNIAAFMSAIARRLRDR